MKERDSIPILCSLTSAELREREATLLAQFGLRSLKLRSFKRVMLFVSAQMAS
jgi:hypothetical protein